MSRPSTGWLTFGAVAAGVVAVAAALAALWAENEARHKQALVDSHVIHQQNNRSIVERQELFRQAARRQAEVADLRGQVQGLRDAAKDLRERVGRLEAAGAPAAPAR
jgi:ubiquinone biosynthesis protein UbiJ